MMKKIFLLGLLAAACLQSCRSTSVGLIAEPSTYRITQLQGQSLPLSADAPCTFTFQEGRIGATLGCNSLFAGYEKGPQGKIRFTDPGSTLMLCPDEARERVFLEVLRRTVRYQSIAQGLVFLDAQGQVLFQLEK